MLARQKVSVKENKIENSLPKMLPGAVCAQMIRCGKPTCKCGRGELHKAYYRFVWQNGKQHKFYVRRDEVEQVRQACDAHRGEVKKCRAQRMAAQTLIRSLRAGLADFDQLIAQLRGK
jgi:hypothetical protein